MIARYDGRSGHWSVAGLAVSLLIAGVAFTGGVSGQDAALPAPGLPSPTAAQPRAGDGSKPASERIVEPHDGTHPAAAAAAKQHAANLTPPGAAGGGEPVVADEDVDAGLLAQLDRKLPEASFDGAALSDVVDFLRDVSGSNIVVEWGHLANAGVDRNAPVTLRVRNVKFSRAVDLVLSSAAAGVPVGYSLDGNILRISTLEHLDHLTDVRAYDVRDILASEAKMEELTKLITEAVAPDSWRSSGGSVGVILPTRNKLIVTQTPMNHRQIRSVLQMLREQPREPARASDSASAAQGPTQPAPN